MSKVVAAPRPAASERRHPQRTCVSCRTTANKREFVRIVRTADRHVIPDPSGKAPGRGAYLCTNLTCWEKATRTGLLDKALRTTVSDSDETQIMKYGREIDEGTAQ